MSKQMMEVTDLRTIGRYYNIFSKEQEVIKKIYLIYEDDILDSAIGSFADSNLDDYNLYLQASISYLKGFITEDEVVSWYKMIDAESDQISNKDLQQIAQLSVKESSDVIIIQSNRY